MTDSVLLLIAGLFFILFSVFSLWFVRREYRLYGKLTWLGSIIHCAMYGPHVILSGLIIGWPETLPEMGCVTVTGLALMVIGWGITIYAMDFFRTFSRWLGNETPGLTVNRLYRISRNPQFVGYGLFFVGVFITWWTPLAIIGLLSYAALVYAVARVEEEHLTRVYGQAYLEYCNRVPRFFGLLK